MEEGGEPVDAEDSGFESSGTNQRTIERHREPNERAMYLLGSDDGCRSGSFSLTTTIDERSSRMKSLRSYSTRPGALEGDRRDVFFSSVIKVLL